MLWARFNPTAADGGRRPAPRALEVFGELDAVQERDEARNAALRLREAIARSPLDFVRSSHHARPLTARRWAG